MLLLRKFQTFNASIFNKCNPTISTPRTDPDFIFTYCTIVDYIYLDAYISDQLEVEAGKMYSQLLHYRK